MKPILVVDDDSEIRAIIRETLEKNFNTQMIEATGGREAILLLRATEFSLIISDLSMPEGDGLSIFLHLISSNIKTPFILFTGSSEAHVLRDRMPIFEKLDFLKLLDEVKALRIFLTRAR